MTASVPTAPFAPTHTDTQTGLPVRLEPNRDGTAALVLLATGRPLTAVALPLPERFVPVDPERAGVSAGISHREAVDAMQTVLAYLAAFPGTHRSASRLAERWGLARWRFAEGDRVQVVATGMVAAVQDVLTGGAYHLGDESALPLGAVGEVIEVRGYGPDDPTADGTLVVHFAWTEDKRDGGSRRRAVATFGSDSGFAPWQGEVPKRGIAPVQKTARGAA